MKASEAKANQKRIAKDFDLGWWYGTRCNKCCGVYPKLMHEGNSACANTYYQCEVCGTRTKGYVMPWLAEEAWNKGKTIGGQLNLFDYEPG